MANKHDELTTYLTDGKRHAELSSDSLELMGKRAANMFLDFKIPLNEGIAKVASEYTDINADQLKRIVEFANTSVYLSQHDGNKVAGAETSYPQFELADASSILNNISNSASSTTSTKANVDYSRQVERKEKTSSIESDKMLSELFGEASTVKLASKMSLQEAAAEDLLIAKHTAEDLRDNLAESYNRIDEMYKQASNEYYDLVKRYLLDDGDFSHVMVAARSTSLEDAKIAHVIKPVVEKLLMEKVASSKHLNQAVRNLEKVAFRVVNPDHPLVKIFSGLVLLGEEKRASWTALKEATGQYEKVAKVIKETFFAKASK